MRYGISSKALGLLIVLGLGALPGRPSVAQQPLNINAYQLTFEESFDSLDVSAWGERSSRWIAHTPWNGDFGDARFTDPAPGFPFTTDQGILKIEARKEADGTWRSG
ncbi:glycoside hydrolase family 16 protein, partial [Rhizobium ruizarguesonis]